MALVITVALLAPAAQAQRAESAGTSTAGFTTYLTFPEIAQALSTPDQPVQCVPSLANRAALVVLKESRTRQQKIDALTRALDIVLLPSPDPAERSRGVLLLDRDPAVAKRETEWRRVFSANVQSTLYAQYAVIQRRINREPLQDFK